MLSCLHDCLPNYAGASNATQTRISCDPVWNAIKSEGREIAGAEHVLQPMLDRVVFGEHSLASGTARLLSERLADTFVDAHALYQELIDQADRDIGESIRADLLSIRDADPATESLATPYLYFKGFHALQTYRFANALWKQGRDSLALHLQARSSQVFGVDIHPAAKIGDGVFVDHATGVVIGETSIVGNDVTILHGVTLGATGNQTGDRHPKIGNGVFIGAQAQVIGNIQIGDNARIGAGSVVVKNVDAGCTVAGVPARIVKRRSAPSVPLKTFAAGA